MARILFKGGASGSGGFETYANVAALPSSASDGALAYTTAEGRVWRFHTTVDSRWFPVEYGEGGSLVEGDTGDSLFFDATVDTLSSVLAGDFEQAYLTPVTEGAGVFEFDGTTGGTGCGLKFYTAAGELNSNNLYVAIIEWAGTSGLGGRDGYFFLAAAASHQSYFTLNNAGTMSFVDQIYQENFGGAGIGRLSANAFDPVHVHFNFKRPAIKSTCQAYLPDVIEPAIRVPLNGQPIGAADRYVWIYTDTSRKMQVRRLLLAKFPNPATAGLRGH